MKKILLIASLCLLVTNYGFNQDYSTAIGIKGGFSGIGALNIKHSLGGSAAFEGSIGGGSNLLWLQGLYEINNPIEGGLSWYYGGGADIGFWTYSRSYYNKYNVAYYNDLDDDDDFYFGNRYNGHRAFGGLDGVIGLEYTFAKIPLNLALDASPALRLFPRVGFALYGSIAARFAIK
jgi:hypothetical protein